MAGMRFRNIEGYWKPNFNQFGKPIVCDSQPEATWNVVSYATDPGADAEVLERQYYGAFHGGIWQLEATATGTNDALVTAGFPIAGIAVGQEYEIELDVGYGSVPYMAVDIVGFSTSPKTVYLDLENRAVVSASSGVTAAVVGGGDVGARYRFTLTVTDAGATQEVVLYLASTTGSKTFSGAIGDHAKLGNDLDATGYQDPAEGSPDNIRWRSTGTAYVVDCCAPCLSALQCLRRTPLKLATDGINVKEWLEVVPGTALATNRHESLVKIYDPTGNEVNTIFDGVWVLEPFNPESGPQPWPTSPPPDGLDYAWGPYEGLPLQAAFWQSTGYRQLDFPLTTRFFEEGTENFIGHSRIYLMATAECVDNEGIESLKFTVYLKFAVEVGSLEGCSPDGADFVRLAHWPVMESAPIPLAGLQMSDLTDLTCTQLDSPVWDSVYGGLYETAGDDAVELCDEIADPCWCWWDDAADKAAAPLPELTGGFNELSGLRTNCLSYPDGDVHDLCKKYCDDDGDGTQDPVADLIDFEYKTDGCYKWFRAIYPKTCMDIYLFGALTCAPTILWSFGEEGELVWHQIEGTTLAGLAGKETVTMTLVACDGCIYTVTKEIECSCLCDEGAFASISIDYLGESPPFPGGIGVPCTDFPGTTFTWRIYGHAAHSACPTGFVEVQTSDSSWPTYDCCPCPDGVPDVDPLECEDLEPWQTQSALGDGDWVEVTVGFDEAKCMRWRTWDDCCGCAGPWSYVLFYVECEEPRPDPSEGCPWL